MDKTCKDTVGNYHSLIEFLMGCSTRSGRYFTDGGEAGIARVKNELLPRFRNAKIFSIDPSVAVQVYDVIDQHVAEESRAVSPELKARLFSKERHLRSPTGPQYRAAPASTFTSFSTNLRVVREIGINGNLKVV